MTRPDAITCTFSLALSCAAWAASPSTVPATRETPANPPPATYLPPSADQLLQLTDTTAPDDATVRQLLAQLSGDGLVREAAVRRLIANPSAAAGPAVELFASPDARLPTRLAVLDLLVAWHAPTEGIDPWHADSITPQRIDALRRWATARRDAGPIATNDFATTLPTTAATDSPDVIAGLAAARSTAPTTAPAAMISESDLADARRELARLLDASSAADERIVRERLVRYGLPLLPEVYARLKDAPDDDDRRRLRALRYRLVASDRLALSWMDGLEALAAIEQAQRLAALDVLSRRATPADQRLLLELFADPDALFRERSLAVLKSIGGASATESIAMLLRDPEPNVRAAVLKQLAEAPPQEMIGEVVAYVGTEKDADLVVHAVRVLRTAKGPQSLAALKTLLPHESWRVRAEVVEAIDDLADELQQQEEKASTYAALIRLLDDPDGFVIARAVTALGKANLITAFEPMAKAAKKHPQLAGDVVAAMTRQSSEAAMPHLREFAKHASPAVRAAAVGGMCEIDPEEASEQIVAALRDPESRVRIAAAVGLLDALGELTPPEQTETNFLGMRRTIRNDRAKWLESFRGIVSVAPSTVATSAPTTLASAIAPNAGGETPNPTVSVETAVEGEVSFDGPPPGNLFPGVHTSDGNAAAVATSSARPKWLDAALPAVTPMLKAASAEERAAAAGPLIAAGRDDPALDVLRAATKADAKARYRAAATLAWLPWDRRLALFELIVATQDEDGQLSSAIQSMAASADPRASEPLWKLLAQPSADVKTLDAVINGLRKVYFGERYYDTSSLTEAQKKPAIEAMNRVAQSGAELQKSAALVLLLGVSLPDASAQARRILGDATSSEWMRIDALQVALLSADREQGQQLATKHLADPALAKVALPYFAAGGSSLQQLRGDVYLYFNNPAASQGNDFTGTGQPVAVERPKDLPTETLTAILTGPDPKLAAYAAYVLALGGDRRAFDTLRDHWQTAEKADQAWQRLVFRAAAAVNDDSLTPTLEELYGLIGPADHRLREFYWTIRSIKGEKILALRKRIRDEAGMDHLR